MRTIEIEVVSNGFIVRSLESLEIARVYTDLAAVLLYLATGFAGIDYTPAGIAILRQQLRQAMGVKP